jgi:hypothetical protein
MRELSSAELNQILLHELAHFRRWDDWTNLAQQIVKALFFFHPAVWWIDKKVAVEREMACDDAVVAETRSPRAYAECLARLAEKSFLRRTIALAQAALGKVRQTSERVAQILDINRPAPSSRSWGAVASLVAVLTVGCGVLYSRAPELIGFGDSAHRLPIDAANIAGRSTSELSDVPKLPITQANLNLPVRPTKLIGRTAARQVPNPERRLEANNKSAKTREEGLVHLARSASAIIPVSQTFLVVVEREGTTPADQQVYQIQMWRVTVLRTMIGAPSRQTSRSET